MSSITNHINEKYPTIEFNFLMNRSDKEKSLYNNEIKNILKMINHLKKLKIIKILARIN